MIGFCVVSFSTGWKAVFLGSGNGAQWFGVPCSQEHQVLTHSVKRSHRPEASGQLYGVLVFPGQMFGYFLEICLHSLLGFNILVETSLC